MVSTLCDKASRLARFRAKSLASKVSWLRRATLGRCAVNCASIGLKIPRKYLFLICLKRI